MDISRLVMKQPFSARGFSAGEGFFSRLVLNISQTRGIVIFLFTPLACKACVTECKIDSNRLKQNYPTQRVGKVDSMGKRSGILLCNDLDAY